MAEFSKSKRLLIKAVKETTYSVDPGSGYKIIYANGDPKTKMTGEQIKRDVVSEQFGGFGSVIRGKLFDHTYQLEGKGGGLDTSVLQEPPSGIFLESCALKKQQGFHVVLTNISGSSAFKYGETIKDNGTNETVGTFLCMIGTTMHLIGTTQPTAADVLIGETSGRQGTVSGTPKDAFFYVPTSNEIDIASLTIHAYEDAQRKIATGVRGDVSISLDKGFGKFDFTLKGKYSDPTNQTFPDGEIDNVKPPITDGMDLVLGSVDTSKVALQKVDVKLGNSVSAINDLQQTTGITAIGISNGDPTGTLSISKPPQLTDLNPFAWLGDGITPPTIMPAMFTVGANRTDHVAYSIVVPNLQITDVDDTGNQDGNTLYSLPFSCTKTGDGTPTIYLTFF